MMRIPVIVFVVATVAVAFAFRPENAGGWIFWTTLAVAYGVLAVLSAYRMWDDGTLRDRLRLRGGDLTIGALAGGVLLIASWAGRTSLAPPDTAQNLWLYMIYNQAGEPEAVQRSVWLTLTLVWIVTCEEVAWRGMVQGIFTERLGKRRGWIVTALLYGLTLAPTLFTLRVPVAGLNPLLLLAGIGCGLVWSFLMSLTGRLPPVIISHLVFTYFSVVQFRLPGL